MAFTMLPIRKFRFYLSADNISLTFLSIQYTVKMFLITWIILTFIFDAFNYAINYLIIDI